jgi:hypothetical protein
MWTAEFWRATGERAIRTTAQVLLALWMGSGVFNAFSIDVVESLGVALGAALFSVLMSLAPVGPDGSPSWVRDRDAAR